MSTQALPMEEPRVRRVIPRDWSTRLALLSAAAFMILFLIVPLYFMLRRSVYDRDGQFVGLDNYLAYLAKPSALISIQHSLFIAIVSTILTVGLAFLYAYGISRSRIPGKELFRGAAMIPLLTPSLLFAMSLIQLFGNQGMLKDLLFGESIYGPIGITVGLTFAHFPHVFIILSTALLIADSRLYEAAECLGAGKIRTFFTVTIPGIRYGLISAAIVSFTLSITDFGVPKVIGGQYHVLATDIYMEVVGQQNFEMGAVVSVILLVPAIIAFIIDRMARRRQVAMLTTRTVPYEPKPSALRDAAAFLYCAAIALMMIGIVAVAVVSSFIKFWPYDLGLTLRNYNFDLFAGGGWQAYLNSLLMALCTAIIGTITVFVGAYLTEKTATLGPLRRLYQVLAVLPMAVPGLVLGLSYIFFFNMPGNPLHVLYGTMAILVLSTVVHYYTVCHLTALTALKQLDSEFEAVSDSLKAPRYKTFFRVTVPICLPTILDISVYYFLSAMTTVSVVIFLYSAHTKLASVAILNMDDAGEFAPAAAMATIIVVTCIAVRVVHFLATRGLYRRSQAWRQR